MGLVVGEQEQQVRGREAVIAPVELPCRNVAAAGEELHLPNIEARPLAGLTGPHHALALENAHTNKATYNIALYRSMARSCLFLLIRTLHIPMHCNKILSGVPTNGQCSPNGSRKTLTLF